MRELTFVSPGRLEWREAPAPALEGDRQAIVRPLAVATCDLDAAIVRGRAPVEGPFPFGHECVAEVLEVGDTVGKVAPGDRVSVPFQVSCGECAACRRGRTANCETVPRLSMYGLGALSGAPWGGFLSDAVRVPYADHMLVPLPGDAQPESLASLSDNIADGWRTVGPPLEAEPGAAVLVVAGGGSVALYASAIAVALGAERVDVVGARPRELEVAALLGADVVEGPIPERLGPYPITVDPSARRAGLACALRSTAPDGICTSSGILFEPETPVPLLEMFMSGIRFHTGRVHARPAMPPALELVTRGLLRPELVTARVADWEDAPDALADHDSKLVISRRS